MIDADRPPEGTQKPNVYSMCRNCLDHEVDAKGKFALTTTDKLFWNVQVGEWWCEDCMSYHVALSGIRLDKWLEKKDV